MLRFLIQNSILHFPLKFLLINLIHSSVNLLLIAIMLLYTIHYSFFIANSSILNLVDSSLFQSVSEIFFSIIISDLTRFNMGIYALVLKIAIIGQQFSK